MSEVLDHYLQESRLTSTTEGGRLVLETAAGMTPAGLIANPVFFSGAMSRPDVAAAGLRSLVEIASTRYFNPIPGGFASLDPVVTAQGDRLRCEAFSACNGVYARLDLLSDSFDEASLGFGTTNIDINAPLALALASVRAQDRLHLSVGPEHIEFETPHGVATERKVKLPERWVRALAETQSLATMLQPRARLDAMAWRRFVNALSMSGGSGAGQSMWLVPSGASLRQTSRAQVGAIALSGTARLSALKRLQHLVQSVNIYGPSVSAETRAAISAWEFLLPGARLTLMLSPEPYRGFSGEGAMLQVLGKAQAEDALTIGELLAWEAHIDQPGLAREMDVPETRIHQGLQVLASAGQVGFDLQEQSYFHRLLPFSESRLEKNYPRLAAARELIALDAVKPDGDRLRVHSEQHFHWVNPTPGSERCTCYFWSKYQGSRGPCKHILAAQLYMS
ncbi:SWIM zinc finger family protein [Uliginosibacterium sp. H3]|uniref:SWIM zinc finger family protein n=1 Tax=Uliginosibacterium silvisoli TaxID=3114758 RepID=A0ABU6K0W6_9RHOO|nr:SWIM zinc finger family protein [Uliginosibacterium sp. H3]